MLQDLTWGRLENEFRNLSPREEDLVICVRGNAMLVHPEDVGFPTVRQVMDWEHAGWNRWREEGLRYLFCLHGGNYFLWMGEAGECPEEGYAYVPVRQLRSLRAKEQCYAAMTAWHLFVWHRTIRSVSS